MRIIEPGDRVLRKRDGRTGKVIYSAFGGDELPVVWDDTKDVKYVPQHELRLLNADMARKGAAVKGNDEQGVDAVS